MFDKLASGIAWKVSAFGVILVRIFPHSDFSKLHDAQKYWQQHFAKLVEKHRRYSPFLLKVQVCL